MLRTFGRRTFDFGHRVAVMAIVNRTPDSFYDRGATFGLDAAVAAGERALAEGADWLDVGGVKAGPGPTVTEAEELDRVLPLVEALRGRSDAVISV
ncbi:MAG TPA: dihydropteroate synthase, partial [Actinomycetes bacterium]|nr:dihydropteroate synthase [Actinomycetes bacterium]